ncbi:hypothetical protein M514_02419 [Trichuris suis]|uniref:Uncharacterized protein n=1 Tax=Trichuris suis TaxID=68888 RepID=A0A085N5R0_9BILA|nr:hypothetical protein M513_02419 [Trichuris suis]KFD64806.1 hypothetical protein M514_02419 [Trichuris suis]
MCEVFTESSPEKKCGFTRMTQATEGIRTSEAQSRRGQRTRLWHPFFGTQMESLIDFLEREKTVTGSYYSTLSQKSARKVARGAVFHHDNVPVHSPRNVKSILREFRWEVSYSTSRHLPYSSDLVV